MMVVAVPHLALRGDPRTAEAEHTIARLTLARYEPPAPGPLEVEIVMHAGPGRAPADPDGASAPVRRAIDAWAPSPEPHVYAVRYERADAPAGVVLRIGPALRRRTLHATHGSGRPPRTLAGVP